MGKLTSWYSVLREQNYQFILVSILSSLGSGGMLTWYLTNNGSKVSQEDDGYIYLPDPALSNLDAQEKSHKKSWLMTVLSTKGINEDNILQLVAATQFLNSVTKFMLIKKLSLLRNLEEYKCIQIAQALDMRSAIQLARIPTSDLRFFLAPRIKPDNSISFEEDLCNFLDQINIQTLSEHSKPIILKALSLLKNDTEYKDKNVISPWLTDYNNIKLSLSENRIVSFLEALLYLTQLEDDCQNVIKWNGLDLLHKCHSLHAHSIIVQNCIGQILGNLACYSSLHKNIYQSGWIGKLAEWSRNQMTEIFLPAVKTLINLNQDNHSHIYPQGIYVAYPKWLSEESPTKFDVIFVHGFYGSAFKSWRLRDSPVEEPVDKHGIQRIPAAVTRLATLRVRRNPVSLWPYDWLAKDFGQSRILLTDYPTSLTQWKGNSESNKLDLNERSQILLDRLLASGVGNRPVIWIAHSMGGLLVKNMLHIASCSESPAVNKLAFNSKAIVFYGVPHRGCNLAKINTPASMILQPSPEIRDLKPDSPVLVKLHHNFLNIAKRFNYKILSFGETEEVYFSRKFNLKTLLVPPESADPGVGEFVTQKVNHVNICKPESRESVLYQKVVDLISEVTSRL